MAPDPMARVIISDPILSKNTHNKITQSASSWKYLFICLDMCMDMDMFPRFIHTARARHQSTRPFTPPPLWTTTALLAQVCARQYNTSGRCHSSFRSCLESNVLPEGLSGRRTTSSTELLSASSGGFAAAASHSETSAPNPAGVQWQCHLTRRLRQVFIGQPAYRHHTTVEQAGQCW